MTQYLLNDSIKYMIFGGGNGIQPAVTATIAIRNGNSDTDVPAALYCMQILFEANTFKFESGSVCFCLIKSDNF